jgi:hypothetical protein
MKYLADWWYRDRYNRNIVASIRESLAFIDCALRFAANQQTILTFTRLRRALSVFEARWSEQISKGGIT